MTQTFTHAVYHLAANPEFAPPLREEVERIIAEEGWSKKAMSRMHRVDSFLRESLRYNGIESSTSLIDPRFNSHVSLIVIQLSSCARSSAISISPTVHVCQQA